jgi:uncharacterized protein YjbI with pentapeptide repeats
MGDCMADEKQLEILKQGVEAWNSWRRKNPDVHIDFSEAKEDNLRELYRMDDHERSRVNLREANLREADLSGADLREADLSGADLRDADLRGAFLYRANFTGADLWGANFGGADLSEADLLEADLRCADLTGAYLRSASFQEANLSWARLMEADLTRASFNLADLKGADLSKADLTDVDLSDANLTRANLSKTIFTGASFALTTIVDNDLGDSIGLEKTKHAGRSAIGSDTIRNSKGKIPVAFLRGCGLSDLEIESAKLAAPGLDPEQVTQITYEIYRLYCDQPIQFYSCFISYNSKDQKFAQRLHDDLQNNGVRCWFAPEDMKIGDEFRRTIGQEIRVRDKLLIILSKNSIHSEWVGDEVEKALAGEKESKALKLFPIRLDGAVLKAKDDWAEKIRLRRHIGDFSAWKDEGKYRKAFERLLRDLKAE